MPDINSPMEIEKNKKSKILYTSILLLIIICVGSSIAYAMRTSIYNTMDKLKLIPRAENFTELYFENSSSLPKQTTAKQPISFSFTIHNLEGGTTTYPYVVYFQYPSGDQVVFATSTVTLAANASTTIDVSHIFAASNETGIVIVTLTTLDQSIDFLLSETSYRNTEANKI